MSKNITVVIRLLVEAANEGRLVGHAEVVRSGEVVSITSAHDLERLARRLADLTPAPDFTPAAGLTPSAAPLAAPRPA
ncbi:MAG: hypothetical protein JWL72_3899 [Ilumatobacteraceae bacterium]|nr:hypothetical protein [Ilumatobacteraceae bacterium]MCU1390561.1 hypothetical protein [Ilumatobacteraceae bacterium]